jgi:hypothetical protein
MLSRIGVTGFAEQRERIRDLTKALVRERNALEILLTRE